MSVATQVTTDEYAIYNGDCIECIKTLPDASVGMSVYSPPFMGLYQYSSDANDMSNCIDKDEFFEHYAFLVDELCRVIQPGRICAVHCMDIPLSNAGSSGASDTGAREARVHVWRTQGDMERTADGQKSNDDEVAASQNDL
jgi:hypothetical protein